MFKETQSLQSVPVLRSPGAVQSRTLPGRAELCLAEGEAGRSAQLEEVRRVGTKPIARTPGFVQEFSCFFIHTLFHSLTGSQKLAER